MGEKSLLLGFEEYADFAAQCVMGHDGHYGGTGYPGGLEVCNQDERRDANLSLNDVSQISQQPLTLGYLWA